MFQVLNCLLTEHDWRLVVVAGLVLITLYGPRSPLGVNLAQTRIAIFVALLVAWT